MTIINTYMRKLLNAFKGVKGFTLIELLVVIGILGILAAALIATIDPFEQLKKGRDTTTRNAALEYLNALTRYYATHGEFPWDDGICTAPTAADQTLTDIVDCTTALEDEGELKEGFGDAIAEGTGSGVAGDIKIRTVANSADVRVCFSPTAKSNKNAPETKFDSSCTGTEDTTNCPAADANDGDCWQEFK